MVETAVPESKKLKNVAILGAINPSNAGTGEPLLRYDEHPEIEARLKKKVGKYSMQLSQRWETFINEPEGSPEELKAAENLAKTYLLKTAQLASEHPIEASRDIWAEYFTDASIELYGRPNQELVTSIVSSEIEEIKQAQVQTSEMEELLDLYSRYLPVEEAVPVEKSYDEIMKIIRSTGDYLKGTFRDVLEVVADDDRKYSPLEQVKLLKAALVSLELLADRETSVLNGASEWTVVLVKGTMLRVESRKKQILVGEDRSYVFGSDFKATIAHEVLGHVLRAINAYARNDTSLAVGLGGYEVFEEGFATFLETAIIDRIPERIQDRYVDIGTAIGYDGLPQINRTNLHRIAVLRKITKAQLDGVEPSEDDIKKYTKDSQIHVDRIYRGSSGDDSRKVQGVFTKDATYFLGLEAAVNYIQHELSDGKNINEIISFLQQGKVDPRIKAHKDRIQTLIDNTV